MLIRRLYDERHALLVEHRAGTMTSEQAYRLANVEAYIDDLEAQEQRLRFPDGHPMDNWIREAEKLLEELQPKGPPDNG